MALVIHLIPYHGIGGVERAAASMRTVSPVGIDFHVEHIFPPSAANNRWVVWNPWHFLRTAVKLWRSQPNVLIVSLWRAYAVGIVVKLLRPKLRLVVFLHYPLDVHAPDRFLTRLAARLACRVWADSKETLTRRLPGLEADKGQVISFVTERIAALPEASMSPTFVFWGRLHAQKGLSRALCIFAAIKTRRPAARFWIIGPDGGDLSRLRGQVAVLGLGEAVEFLGPKDFAEIEQLARNASFYLQTSDLEGMAMSVVEAMQLGLVPVVTPVGEIANYCHDGINAVVVMSDQQAQADVLNLLCASESFHSMRASAIATWANKPLYRDSVLSACQNVLAAQSAT